MQNKKEQYVNSKGTAAANDQPDVPCTDGIISLKCFR